jgi:predicted transcriptional regulator
MTEAVFSPQQLAERWGYHENTIRRMEEDGRLHRLTGLPMVRYSAKEVLQLESIGPEAKGMTAWERKQKDDRIAELEATVQKLKDRLCKIQQLTLGGNV